MNGTLSVIICYNIAICHRGNFLMKRITQPPSQAPNPTNRRESCMRPSRDMAQPEIDCTGTHSQTLQSVLLLFICTKYVVQDIKSVFDFRPPSAAAGFPTEECQTPHCGTCKNDILNHAYVRSSKYDLELQVCRLSILG